MKSLNEYNNANIKLVNTFKELYGDYVSDITTASGVEMFSIYVPDKDVIKYPSSYKEKHGFQFTIEIRNGKVTSYWENGEQRYVSSTEFKSIMSKRKIK